MDIDLTPIFVALLGSLGLVVPAYLAFLQAKISALQSKADSINDAVDHRHLTSDSEGNAPGKLYDVLLRTDARIIEILKWQQKWDGPWQDGNDIREFLSKFEKLESMVANLNEKCPGGNNDVSANTTHIQGRHDGEL